MPHESEVELPPGATISSLLALLCDRHKELYREIFQSPETLKPYVNVLKNGRNVFFTGNMATTLASADVVAIFPPVAGG